MAELDYAMLAEFARLDASGLLTVVGGNFDQVATGRSGVVYPCALFLRFRLDQGEDSVSFEVKINGADEPEPIVGVTGSAQISPDAASIDGKYYPQSVVPLGVPLMKAGRYTVAVTVDGEVAREMPFVVTFSEPEAD